MRIFLALAVLVLISCNKKETFDFKTVTLTSIKKTDFLGKSYYDAVELTPESYTQQRNLHQIVAGFVFEEKKAAVVIELDYDNATVTFRKTGPESDYFVTVLSQLYEVDVQSQTMKEKVIFDFMDNTPKETDILQAEFKNYKLNASESITNVEAMLLLSLTQGSIKLMEYEAGKNRENFVRYFVAD